MKEATTLEPLLAGGTASKARHAPEGGSGERSPRRGRLEKRLLALLAAFALAGAAILLYQAVHYMATHESTDDAYTAGHLHQVSSRIDGTVDQVLVDDNWHVKAGQLLVVLDPRDYQVKVEQARAALETARRQADSARTAITLSSVTAEGKTTEAAGDLSGAVAQIARSEAAVAEAKAAVPEANALLEQKKAELKRAFADYQRYAALAGEGAVSLQQRDSAVRDYEVARHSAAAAEDAVRQAHARLAQAQEEARAARAALEHTRGLLKQAEATHVQTTVNEHQFAVARSAIAEAAARLHDAELQLSYTKIVAPTSGRVGRKSVEVGQRVQPGQPLMTVVSDDAWVVANFKETQLEHMRPGQPAELKVDSFPHHKFAGTVESLSPGSGSTFALLPSDNATGNFTKIVQRVPVKILFDRPSTKGFENLIVPGMSVVVTVRTGR